MSGDRFFSKASTDIFRPFTGRHRGIFFETVVELYERTMGANADFDLVLDRERLKDIVLGCVSRNRDLIVQNSGASDDAEPELDGDVAFVIKRLVEFGIIEQYPDANKLRTLWRFTREGKVIAKIHSSSWLLGETKGISPHSPKQVLGRYSQGHRYHFRAPLDEADLQRQGYYRYGVASKVNSLTVRQLDVSLFGRAPATFSDQASLG